MSPIFYSLVVTASLIGQTADDDADAARQRSIRAAIGHLGAEDYASRELAYRQLWRHGLAAQPALKRAATSGDGETRLRAKRLLRDFDYGIVPGADAETQQLIRGFRDGGPAERTAAFQRLVQRQRMEILERLIRLEADPQARSLLLMQMFQDDQIVDRYIQRDRVDALVEAVGADQDERWKRAVTIQLMFAPNTLSRLAETGALDKVLPLIRDETDAQVRQSMLGVIFRTGGIGVILAQNKLDFVLDILRGEPDRKIRGGLLGEIFANPQAAQAIVAHKQLDVILNFSREQTDPETQQKLIERMVASSPVVESLLKEGGIERVLALVSRESDPVRRGRLLGAAIASSAVRNFIRRNGLSELAIKLAKEETNESARHEFLQALLHDTSFIYALNNEATVAELWQLIKADKDAKWRAQALIVLLQSHRSNALLKDREEAAWILKLASDDTAGPLREDILRFLLPNVEAQRALIAGGHFDTMLTLARELPIRSRGDILASFLAGSGVAEHLVATKRIELLIRVADEEPDAAARQQCLQGVFRNTTAMTALLAAGHYATFRDLIQRDDDAARRASLFGAFIQNYHVMEELTKRGDSKLLLAYAEAKEEGPRRQFLPRLFQNHRAVTLLMEEGHFDRLVALAKQDGGTNFDEFLAVPKVIEHLAATKQFALFLDFAADEADDNTRRNLLRNVFVYSRNVDALIASEDFDRLLRLIQAERDATWRSSLLGPVVSSPQVVKHFATLKKLDVFLSIITDEPEPVVRAGLMSYLTNRSDSLNLLIEHGHLDTMISLTNRYIAGQIRGDVLARVVTNAKALERLKADRRIGFLLSFTDDPDATFRSAYISRLFSSTGATDLLVEHGYYGDVFTIATAGGDAKVRAALIQRLLSSSKAIEQMIARGDVATLVSIVKGEADGASRRDYLTIICGNDLLMEEMLKGDLFDSLLAKLRSEKDAANRKRQLATLVYSAKAIAKMAADEQLEQIVSDALVEADTDVRQIWLSNVFRRAPSFEALVRLGYGERLLDSAQKGIPVASQQSLLRAVFTNRNAVAALIEKGHFERLFTAAKSHGGRLLGELLRSPVVIEHYVATKQLAVIFEATKNELDTNARYSVLYALAQSQQTCKAMLEAGQFETWCELVQGMPDANQQTSLFSTAFSSLDVIKHYVDTKTLDRLFAYLEQKATPVARARILLTVFGRSDALNLLIENGHYEALLRISSEHTSGDTRDRLLAQLLTSPKGLAKLVAEGQVDSLLTYATAADGSVSVPFVSSLLTNYSAVSLLIDRGHFTELYKFATSSDDAGTRTTLLGNLLMNQKAIQQLTTSGQLAVVVSYAQEETNTSLRGVYLARICSNQRLIAELARSELFDKLVKVCESTPDVNERRRLFASLLYCDAAIDKFAAAQRLEKLITGSLAEPDKNRQVSWLTSVLGNSNSFAALMKHGFGDRVLEAARQQLDANRLQSVYRSMLSNPAVMSRFAKSGQHQFLLKLLADEPGGDQYPYILYQVAANEDALRAIVKAGELNQLLARAAKVSRESTRESLRRQILVSHGTISALAEQDKLPALFELVRGEENAALRRSCLQSLVFNDRTRRFLANVTQPEAIVSLVADEGANYRAGMVMRLLSDTNIRRRWIEANQLAALERLIELAPNDAYRTQYRQDVFYTPSGVMGHLLRQDKFAEAEALLHEDSRERALSWLVSYHTSRGQLAAEIERLQAKDRESRSEYDTRLLAYLLRASGDLAAATGFAKSLDDPRLLRPLLVEQQRWSAAASLQAAAPLPPPVDVAPNVSQDEQTQRVEQLGLLASYYRLAGDEPAAKSTIDEIVALAAANQQNSQLVWYAAQTLLLNDCVDEGLRLVKDSRPLVAFNLFVHRQDFEAAFETVGCGKDFVADRQWYDALPFGTTQSEIQKRFFFAIDVAKTLRLAGRDQAAGSVFSLLEQIIDATPQQGGKWPRQDDLRQWYSGGLYRIGLKRQAWIAAAKTSSPQSVITPIFGNRAGEARVWWALFHSQNSSEQPDLRLQRIDVVMNPSAPETIESFPELVKQAIQLGEAGQDDSFWRGLADTCKALGQQRQAIECFERIENKTLDVTVAQADLLFSSERWSAAATAYHDAWLEDYEQLHLLFLAGVAKQRAGESEEGQAWQRLADLQAFTPQARHRLALALAQRGLVDAANTQWQILLQTAPFESLELNDAARRLAIDAYRDEPQLAAPLWQHYLLGDVRPAFWFLNDVSYLSVPTLLHKIRALGAIERSDFEAAERSMRLALSLSPGDTVIAEELVPLLDAAGQRELGDRFVSQVVGYYEQRCADHPRSAVLHNNLAWGAARCHRHLDEALSHAEKAVELEPGSAGYIDTLAEVHFQLGDRDQAIHWSERAVALRPLGKTLQTQLARFRSAPLPAP